MDTLTHALSGALAARATQGASTALTPARRALLAGVAAAFPDLDYALFVLAPADFLNLHRGPTHSLLLLPLWAALLAWPAARLCAARWRDCLGPCALGLALHLAGDWVTVYGTQLLYPLSTRPFALAISFDFNPWLGALLGIGFVLTWGGRARRVAQLALLAAALALAGQALLRQQALAVAAGGTGTPLAFPQPFSPFEWQLLHVVPEGYRAAWWRFGDALPPAWETLPHPAHAASSLVREAWAAPALAPFRRFAQLPAPYRTDVVGDETCVWFQDLRYRFREGLPAFRQGVCRTAGGDWRGYRLSYFSDTARQGW